PAALRGAEAALARGCVGLRTRRGPWLRLSRSPVPASRRLSFHTLLVRKVLAPRLLIVDAIPTPWSLVATPVTLERLVEAVRVECPDLGLGTRLGLIEGFEKWIAVGDSWVARFPKSKEAAAAMARERELLSRLAGRTTAAIPRPLHVGRQVAFDICTKVPGTSLWDEGREPWRMWPATWQGRGTEEFGAFVAGL